MVTTVVGIAFLCWIVFGIAFVIVCLVEAITEKSHEVIGLTLALLWIASLIISFVCKIGFSDALDKETLDMIKENREQILKRCPTEVGECEIKWLDYRADSLRAEYKVQRLKYE